MNAKIQIMFLCIMSFLIGCATTPTKEQLANAYYGPYPGQYEQIIKNYMKNVLYDPQSAIYEFKSTPISGYGHRWEDKDGFSTLFGKVEFGYVVYVSINAKNQFGGYVGFTPYKIVIRDYVVVTAEKEYR